MWLLGIGELQTTQSHAWAEPRSRSSPVQSEAPKVGEVQTRGVIGDDGNPVLMDGSVDPVWNPPIGTGIRGYGHPGKCT